MPKALKLIRGGLLALLLVLALATNTGSGDAQTHVPLTTVPSEEPRKAVQLVEISTRVVLPADGAKSAPASVLSLTD